MPKNLLLLYILIQIKQNAIIECSYDYIYVAIYILFHNEALFKSRGGLV